MYVCMSVWSARKKVISADLSNVGQGHHLQKSYLGYYTATFNQTHQNYATGADKKA